MIECIVCKNKKIELFKIIDEKKILLVKVQEAKFLDKHNPLMLLMKKNII